MRVGIDSTVTLSLKMHGRGHGAVNVLGTSPVVDTTSSVSGVNIGRE